MAKMVNTMLCLFYHNNLCPTDCVCSHHSTSTCHTQEKVKRASAHIVNTGCSVWSGIVCSWSRHTPEESYAGLTGTCNQLSSKLRNTWRFCDYCEKKNSDSSLMLICFVVVFFTYVFYLQSTHVKLGLHSVYSSYTTIKPSKHRNIKKAIRQKISLKLDPFILMCQMLFWRHYIDILRVWIRPQQVLFRFGVPTLPYSSSVLPPFSLHAHFLSAEPVRRSLSLQLAFLQLLLSFCYDLGISKSCQWGEGLEIQFLWECSLSSPWWSGKRKNRGAYIHIYKVYLWNYSIT